MSNMKLQNVTCPTCQSIRLVWSNVLQKDCRSCAYKKKPKKFGEENTNFRHGKWSSIKVFKCIDCGKRLRTGHATRCNSCAQSGELHPGWNGGLSRFPYPVQFNDALKLKIRTRDGFVCQGENCSMTEEEHLIVYGVALHVHHIDYNKDNLDEKNLISACCQCNIRANYNRSYWQKYYLQKVVA